MVFLVQLVAYKSNSFKVVSSLHTLKGEEKSKKFIRNHNYFTVACNLKGPFSEGSAMSFFKILIICSSLRVEQ